MWRDEYEGTFPAPEKDGEQHCCIHIPVNFLKSRRIESRAEILDYAYTRVNPADAPWLFDRRNKEKIKSEVIGDKRVDGSLLVIFRLETSPDEIPKFKELVVSVIVSDMAFLDTAEKLTLEEFALSSIDRSKVPWLFDPVNWESGRIKTYLEELPDMRGKKVTFQLGPESSLHARRPPLKSIVKPFEITPIPIPQWFEHSERTASEQKRLKLSAEATDRLALQEIVKWRRKNRSVQI